MRILYINSVFGNGSTGRIVADLAKGANHAGYECFVASGFGNSDNVPFAEVKHFCSYSEYRVRNALSKISGLTGGFSLLSTKKQDTTRSLEEPRTNNASNNTTSNTTTNIPPNNRMNSADV